MNTIGVDYQRTATVAMVREETRAVIVGDGWRPRIPTAVAEPNDWGSSALAQPRCVWGGQACDSTILWPSEATAIRFWQGLAERLTRFLGRVSPLTRNGYPTVVTGEQLHDTSRGPAIQSAIRAAGFDLPLVLPAVEALLVRWLILAPPSPNTETTVVLVGVGDCVAEVAGRVVRVDAIGLPRVVGSTSIGVVEGLGHAQLHDRLYRQIVARLNEPLPPAELPIFHDAILEFAQTLHHPDASGTNRWTGAFRGRMYSPFEMTQSEVMSWKETQTAQRELPGRVRSVLKDLGRSQADLLILGGTGTVWPHIALAVQSFGHLWTSGDPSRDLAFGASWYPVLADRLGTVVRTSSRPISQATPAATVRPTIVSPETDDRPPWERRGQE